MIKMTKENGLVVSLSTVMAVLAAMTTAYPVARAALAGEITEQIKAQVQPLTNAMEISTASSIRQLRTAISALNFKKDMCVGVTGCWTINDQRDLDNTLADLVTAEAVLKSLKDSK